MGHKGALLRWRNIGHISLAREYIARADVLDGVVLGKDPNDDE